FPVQEKLEAASLPLANERRPCVLVGGDNMALPASLVSQIGCRCHPSLYTEGDPGEKVELVAGSGVLMTRGQLMNCHLCAGSNTRCCCGGCWPPSLRIPTHIGVFSCWRDGGRGGGGGEV
ncbi:unnamed protein product, partial [Tetraodon nigroviridis]